MSMFRLELRLRRVIFRRHDLEAGRALGAFAIASAVLAVAACGGGGSSGGSGGSGGGSGGTGGTGASSALSPSTLTFASQATGTTSVAQNVTLSDNTGASLSSLAVSVTGDFTETTTCGSTLAASASCQISVSFKPTATGARSGALSVSSSPALTPATVALTGTGVAPTTAAGSMPLISLGVPSYASSGTASNANNGDYDTPWRSSGVPATIALDLSGVPSSERQSIDLVWYNDTTYGYNHTLIGESGYNNPGTYTIEANAAAGGTGAAPTSGWVVLASLSGNTLHSYSYDLPFAGYNWIRGNFSASDGSSGNTDIALNLDVYGASSGVTDGWFFNGDSITANCMGHGSVTDEDENNPSNQVTIAAQSFGQQVNGLLGTNTPLQENAGEPEFTSAQMIPYLAGWLSNVPSKYVTINLGTNDAGGGVAPATFYANMQTLVKAAIAAGKVPIVPTIPYSTDATHQANLPGLNAQIAALYTAYPAIVHGPDLYTYFLDNPKLLRSTDGIHPNAQGCVAYRTLWATWAAKTIY